MTNCTHPDHKRLQDGFGYCPMCPVGPAAADELEEILDQLDDTLAAIVAKSVATRVSTDRRVIDDAFFVAKAALQARERRLVAEARIDELNEILSEYQKALQWQSEHVRKNMEPVINILAKRIGTLKTQEQDNA